MLAKENVSHSLNRHLFPWQMINSLRFTICVKGYNLALQWQETIKGIYQCSSRHTHTHIFSLVLWKNIHLTKTNKEKNTTQQQTPPPPPQNFMKGFQKEDKQGWGSYAPAAAISAWPGEFSARSSTPLAGVTWGTFTLLDTGNPFHWWCRLSLHTGWWDTQSGTSHIFLPSEHEGAVSGERV